ncbi:hypothetical protein BACCIP111895_04886 [Neobacillus rhizosphaerae]|uniref:DNA-binding protein n=1 Tax=Neobacillus rhizosphaerae TaxID=2880965 RepID=A0ABN8KUX8_9BACI|nr:hypothetical protein [Neobacillus rhizosphaerae]CAH2717661.1 hypothetical protein BACCIP111895_04886 [Neobacillus rhizosphaerae]
MNQKSLWLPSLIISLGIIIGSFVIASNPLSVSTATKSKNTVQSSVMLNLNEASKFIGLTTEEIKMIISTEKRSLETSGFYEGTQLPYISVNENLYFEKTKLIVWAQENAAVHKEYKKGF